MSTEPKSGEVIVEKYRLERELGAGGMGSVWLATQLMVDRPVAVKLLHPAFIDEKDLQARFEVEAKAIGKLNHPNVITLYDFGYSDELQAFYTVIEYIDGVSLDKRLNGRMPLREIVSIMRQISLALDHAHHHGILHRDLKPENVMLARMTDGSEMVKVLDFGIARIVKGTYEHESPESQRITKAGEVFGTPAYMSPEQARSIRRLNPSADLYSLGVMFYELVAGKLPFFANSAFDLLMLHVTKPVPPITRPDIPPEINAIIYRLLDKDPEKRFQSGKELAKTLDRLSLPEESEAQDDEDYDSYPTLVSKMPAAFAERAQQETMDAQSRSQPVAAPRPHVPTAAPAPAQPPEHSGYAPYTTAAPAGEVRAHTVLLHGGVEPSREHDTIPQESTNASRGLIVLVVLSVLLLFGIMFVVTGGDTPEEEKKATVVPRHLLSPPASAPEENSAEQATNTQAVPAPEPPKVEAVDPAPKDEVPPEAVAEPPAPTKAPDEGAATEPAPKPKKKTKLKTSGGPRVRP